MSRVVYFEIEAKDPEKKMKFYQEVFDWKFEKMMGMEDYWLIETGPDEQPGINGGIMKSASEDALRTINTISVSNLDEYLTKVEHAGGKITTPKMQVPNVGEFAYCEDLEGVSFGVLQFSKKEQ